jgi:elongation factor G
MPASHCCSSNLISDILDRLSREFNVEAAVGRPQVAYKEALTRPADGESKYARHTRERGEYAHVRVRVYPGEPGSGYVFENKIIGGEVPGQFIKSIEEGIQASMTFGVVAGYPIEDVRIELCGRSYHDVDSSDAAFRTAGGLAFQDAATKAGPVLLEPVMRVQVLVHHEHLDDVVANLSSRRGEIASQDARQGMEVLDALVPLSEMFGYAVDLRERTRGQGTFTMQFDHYRPLQPADGAEGSGDAFVGVPRRPRPAPRQSSIALPEPDGDNPED